MNKISKACMTAAALLAAGGAGAAPGLMTADWAREACAAWNADATPDLDVDYAMNAETRHRIEMGRGEYGPMRAMMFGRLSFEGPMVEAMGNMGPFESFLLLVGKVPGDAASCPK